MATVVVPSVWPPGSNVSITGQVVAGDGHVVGASPGVQFGTPTIRTAVSKALTGLGSAQAFGAVTPKAVVKVLPTGLGTAQQFGLPIVLVQVLVKPSGLGSAQSFGTVTIRVGGQTRTPTPVPSAAAFGTLKLNVRLPSAGGVVSAQSFGTVTIKARITIPVQGVVPYPTYIPSITGQVISGDGHVVGGYGGSQSQFGQPKILATYRLNVGGVSSAAQFGSVKIVQIVHPPGVPSAQAFGTRIGIKFRMLGVPSAGVIGTPWVFLVWMRVFPCTDLDLAEFVCTDLDLEDAACTDITLEPLVPT